MEFLKAVLMAILIHIAAPLVVRYVETNHWVNSTYEVQDSGGKADISKLLDR